MVISVNNRAVGTKFEQEAADYLEKNGYIILQRNFRCKIGEIDLVAKADGYLCFIEVKYRSGISKGYPAEAINLNKIRKITRTAQFYMLLHKLPQETPCRFDAVVILDQEVSLIKNAFEGIN
jgi:putative endonuclease